MRGDARNVNPRGTHGSGSCESPGSRGAAEALPTLCRSRAFVLAPRRPLSPPHFGHGTVFVTPSQDPGGIRLLGFFGVFFCFLPGVSNGFVQGAPLGSCFWKRGYFSAVLMNLLRSLFRVRAFRAGLYESLI